MLQYFNWEVTITIYFLLLLSITQVSPIKGSITFALRSDKFVTFVT